jgi:xanthine dehydrogenase accessory factor
MLDLLRELTTALERCRPCVYCAIVETRGSTPQKAGAAMLVYPDGGQCGTLGGGCVEAEVRQRALRGLNDRAAKAEVFTFHLDDDYGWDDGLICGGRMTILAQPILDFGFRISDYFRHYRNLVESGSGCIEAIAVGAMDLPIGSRFLFTASRAVMVTSDDVAPTDIVMTNLPDLAARPRAMLREGVAYLPTLPRVRLLIVGGGHVAHAVAELAADVDFDVWVMDDRDKFANHERFPQAQQCIVGDIGPTLKGLIADGAVTPSTFALIVTRGHNHDEEALYHLATTSAGYVGMIGSKRKIRLIYDDLMARGISEEILAKVHSPLGLEIGSRTVAEIGVSIVAELIACRNLGYSPRFAEGKPAKTPASSSSHSCGDCPGEDDPK